jgi:hypothetical protein
MPCRRNGPHSVATTEEGNVRPLRISFIIVVLCVVAGVFLTSGATPSSPAEPKRNGCERLYTQKAFYIYADHTFKGRVVTRREGNRVKRMATCQHTDRKEAWAWKKRKLFKFRRWARLHPWAYRRLHIPPALKARLANLRGCETRGIEERYGNNADYRWNGHHDGAYQYDGRTWWEAQNWYAARHKTMPGRTTYAYQATPAHQDVVTASFFPSHTSRWACNA